MAIDLQDAVQDGVGGIATGEVGAEGFGDPHLVDVLATVLVGAPLMVASMAGVKTGDVDCVAVVISHYPFDIA